MQFLMQKRQNFAIFLGQIPKILWALLALNLALILFILTWYWGQTLALSSAFLVMSLGLRHAFDADHIAAIDGATRKFLAQGGDPARTVHATDIVAKNSQLRSSLASKIGGYFALGHTAMMFFLVIAVVAFKRMTATQAVGPENCFNGWCAVISEWVVMLILYALAVSNLWLGFKLWRRVGTSATQHRTGSWLARLLTRVWGIQLRPAHMMVIGMAFGLGFDTATELAMIKIAADASSQTASWINWLIFPALFGASMSLADAMNGAMMGRVYQDNLPQNIHSKPFLRRLNFNILVTLLSGLVALIVATHRLLSWVDEHGGLSEAGRSHQAWLWHSLEFLDQNWAGFGLAIVAMFGLCWVFFHRIGAHEVKL